MTRAGILMSKELADLRQNPSVFVPALLTGLLSVLLPFFVAVIVPFATGERLADSSDFRIALEMYRRTPSMRALEPEAAIQAWVFEQFLMLLVITPVASSMAVAASSVISEKQARTLEPLLATPLTTMELLIGKVLGAFVPSMVLGIASYVVYVAAAALFAHQGAFLILLTGRSLFIVLVLGPLISLTALQLAVCVSSRVNDARSAQQIGGLVILPVTGLVLAQLMGGFILTGPLITGLAIGLVALNLILLGVGIRLFQRESILTRWK